MKIFTIVLATFLLAFAAIVTASKKDGAPVKFTTKPANPAKPSNLAHPSGIDFSWRTKTGQFPKDKPGYLILTTEDALTYSKVLPQFVKQKESMGFYVYVASEKDYGTGKTGKNEQAKQVRAWMLEFHYRAGLKYALLIGNSGSRSADLPAHSIPDGERGGSDAPYGDLDGKWVDLYLNATAEEVRVHPNHDGQRSYIFERALKAGGKREDDLIVSRINYVGNEIGNGAYDLDRILEKTIRYERDTVAGKNLDWRANALSIITNYGGGSWDAPWLKALETEGGTFELRSDRGWIGDLPPENVVDGRPANAELLAQTRRRGLAAHMSHAWNRGAEGIVDQGNLRDIDPRYPSVVSVAGCTAFALGDSCHMGQAWLSGGAIFANGTSWSGNNNCRVPLHTRLLLDRVSVGEAGKNEVVQYGDPSLHVLPPKGTPLRALQISPAVSGYYEEQTMYPNTPIKPLTQTYTLTNRSEAAIKIAVETNVPWLVLSTKSIALAAGESAQVTAASNEKANTLAPGKHVGSVRFRREDGQVDDRSLALGWEPLSITACFSFDAIEGKYLPDLTMVPSVHRDVRSMTVMQNKPVEPGKKNAGLELIPGFALDPQGKVGGALRLDKPKNGLSRGRGFGYTRWRGVSTSFWFKLGELPAAKQTAPIMTEPFKVNVDAAGLVTFAGDGKPANLGTVNVGDWHFVQLRTDLANGKAKASLDGAPEVLADATKPAGDALRLGSFTGSVDELKAWSGELRDADVAGVFAASTKSLAPTPTTPTAGVPLAEGGVLRAPKEIPAVLEMKDPAVKLDIASALAANQLTCTLRDAPEWLDFKDGVFSLKPGTDFDRIEFGGYDLFLVLAAKDGPFAGCVAEHTLKVRIPVPEVRIRIARAADNTLSIVSVGGDKRPLGKGVIRYTTDGSPVNVNSPIYSQPFKTDGDKVTARFFFLGEYPYMPVAMNSEFGITREKWKALSVSGQPGTLPAATNVFDGKPETVWTHKGETLPQALAWDLGEAVKVTAVSCHSTIADNKGRISDYLLHASDDGKTWRQIQSGTYADSPIAQRIELAQACTARYLKLEVTSLHSGTDAVINELEVFSR